MRRNDAQLPKKRDPRDDITDAILNVIRRFLPENTDEEKVRAAIACVLREMHA